MRLLRTLALVMGVACLLIGAYHLLGGIATVPGETQLSATVDSRERFYAAIFGGYGVAWIWVARQPRLPLPAVRALAWTFAAGALGRVVSLAVHGWPQWFQVAEGAVEVVVAPLFLVLAARAERSVSRDASAAG